MSHKQIGWVMFSTLLALTVGILFIASNLVGEPLFQISAEATACFTAYTAGRMWELLTNYERWA